MPKKPRPDRICETCGKTFQLQSRNIGRFCSKPCYGQWIRENRRGKNSHSYGKTAWNKGMKGYHAGEQHWHWSGGKRKHPAGYVEIYQPDHPYARHGGYVYEHRLVMEKHINRFLDPKERVHHINGIRNDNRIENLQLFSSNSAHTKYHSWLKKQRNADINQP